MSICFINKFLIITGIVIIFALGAYFVLNIFLSTRNGHAKVIFINKSHTEVNNINIVTDDSLQIILKKIKIDESGIVYIPVTGEGEYKAGIIFTNGDTLFCGAYIESGYNITETITDNKIIDSTKFY